MGSKNYTCIYDLFAHVETYWWASTSYYIIVKLKILVVNFLNYQIKICLNKLLTS